MLEFALPTSSFFWRGLSWLCCLETPKFHRLQKPRFFGRRQAGKHGGGQGNFWAFWLAGGDPETSPPDSDAAAAARLGSTPQLDTHSLHPLDIISSSKSTNVVRAIITHSSTFTGSVGRSYLFSPTRIRSYAPVRPDRACADACISHLGPIRRSE